MNAISLRAFNDNYIWLIGNGRQAAVVDPGEAAPVTAALAERDLELTAILITHHHHDHTGGVRELLAAWPDAAVYAPADERLPAPGAIALYDGDPVSLPALGLELTVLSIPGHTRGHIAYVGNGMLFCGDTLFSGGCGRLFEGTPEQMHHSLERLAALPDDTQVYCAHEYTLSNLAFCHAVEPDNPALLNYMKQAAKLRQQDVPTLPSTIGREKAINVFLRTGEPAVRAAAQQQAMEELNEDCQVFAALRRWKDHF
ncbi:hydroxyacylglutathione hydrolase [Oceanimonas sp. CHS3-5]|uniref:hydroxyacylglutathione hydrolase n=1 Tax=Oceanimonas sp. CHS3-5 TaxID=3068186 RepID=UPI00273DF940|nr:hydroxyacylglutathione hydrolase [Oceanimonas sp. CHS3-5]MDP5290757.1 hydroxyacylglutathione hydrolase [Oceanimonas sp. CHS3-5]